jgi:hypothetical protein
MSAGTPDLLPMPSIALGVYLHYKNLRYQVLGCVRHSETLEPLVLYRALYGEGGLWVRPYGMFCESIVVDGQSVPRFRFVGDTEL